MLATRRNAAQSVFDHLKNAERTADLALAETAELAAAMLRARIAINVAPVVGHDAFEMVVETFNIQASSRRQLIATHARLAEVKDSIGLREVALGGLMNKEVQAVHVGDAPGTEEARPLTVVRSEAA